MSTMRRFVRITKLDDFVLVCSAIAVVACASVEGPSSGADSLNTGGGGTVPSGAAAGTSLGAGNGGAPAYLDPEICGVMPIIEQECQVCHGHPQLAGAPMPLVTYQDMHADSPSQPGVPVYQRIGQKVHDASKPMPPQGQLSPDELALFDTWVGAGGPDCGFAGSDVTYLDPGSGSTDPATAPGAPPDPGTSPDPGASSDPGLEPVPPPPGDAEFCMEFRAHGPGGQDTPYSARPGEHYYNFVFQTPYDQPSLGLTFDALVESGVVHHFLLFEYLASDVPSDNEGLGIHPNSQLLTGWAPGGEPPDMPPGVGFELPPPGHYFELEIHYYNTGVSNADDHSGIRVCATTQQMPQTASLVWLGTENIAVAAGTQATATGTCTPSNPTGGDINIIASVPHMHQIGTHMKTVINRVAGGQDVLVDEPFEFLDQRSYNTPAVVHPGDTLTTTCTFQNGTAGPVYFGPGSDSEMCYNFVISYPARALAHPGFSLEGSQNTCLW